jgi:hypothetical protein
MIIVANPALVEPVILKIFFLKKIFSKSIFSKKIIASFRQKNRKNQIETGPISTPFLALITFHYFLCTNRPSHATLSTPVLVHTSYTLKLKKIFCILSNSIHEANKYLEV